MPEGYINLQNPIAVNKGAPPIAGMYVGTGLAYSSLATIPSTYLYDGMAVWDKDRKILWQYNYFTGIWSNISFGGRAYFYKGEELLNVEYNSKLTPIVKNTVIKLKAVTFGDISSITWSSPSLTIVNPFNEELTLTPSNVGVYQITLKVSDKNFNKVEHTYSLEVVDDNTIIISNFIVTPDKGFKDKSHVFSFSFDLPSNYDGNLSIITINDGTEIISINASNVTIVGNTYTILNALTKTYSSSTTFILTIIDEDGKTGSKSDSYEAITPLELLTFDVSPIITSTTAQDYIFTIYLTKTYNSADTDSAVLTLSNTNLFGTPIDISVNLVEGSNQVTHTINMAINQTEDIVCTLIDTLNLKSVTSTKTKSIVDNAYTSYDPVLTITPASVVQNEAIDLECTVNFGKPYNAVTTNLAEITYSIEGAVQTPIDLRGSINPLDTSVTVTINDVTLVEDTTFTVTMSETSGIPQTDTFIVTTVSSVLIQSFQVSPNDLYASNYLAATFNLTIDVNAPIIKANTSKITITIGGVDQQLTVTNGDFQIDVGNGTTTIVFTNIQLAINATASAYSVGCTIEGTYNLAAYITNTLTTTVTSYTDLSISSFNVEYIGGYSSYTFSITLGRAPVGAIIATLEYENYRGQLVSSQQSITGITSTFTLQSIKINTISPTFYLSAIETLPSSLETSIALSSKNITLDVVDVVVTVSDVDTSALLDGADVTIGYFTGTTVSGIATIENVPYDSGGTIYQNSKVELAGYATKPITSGSGEVTIDGTPDPETILVGLTNTVGDVYDIYCGGLTVYFQNPALYTFNPNSAPYQLTWGDLQGLKNNIGYINDHLNTPFFFKKVSVTDVDGTGYFTLPLNEFTIDGSFVYFFFYPKDREQPTQWKYVNDGGSWIELDNQYWSQQINPMYTDIDGVESPVPSFNLLINNITDVSMDDHYLYLSKIANSMFSHGTTLEFKP